MCDAALMQAIARVNRRFKDKHGGLIVDYIRISSLEEALAIRPPTENKLVFYPELIDVMEEKYDVVKASFTTSNTTLQVPKRPRNQWNNTVALQTTFLLMIPGPSVSPTKYLPFTSVRTGCPRPEAEAIANDVAFLSVRAICIRC